MSIEVRDNGPRYWQLSGLASTYGRGYFVGHEARDTFRETIEPGAFSHSTSNGHVELRVLHDWSGPVLASTSGKTMALEDRNDGLALGAALSKRSADSQDAVRRIKSGELRAFSVGMSVEEDHWPAPNERRVIRAALHEVSLVDKPCNPGAVVQELRREVRSATGLIEYRFVPLAFRQEQHGRIMSSEYGGPDAEVAEVCPECDGDGWLDAGTKCPSCGGTGVVNYDGVDWPDGARAAAVVPPNLRDAKPGPNAKCGSCEFFNPDARVCTMFDNYEVQASQVCDAYVKDEDFPNLTVGTRRNYSEKQRQDFARKGWALSDGSFPIADRVDLVNAIKLAGQGKDPGRARAHIRKRASLDSSVRAVCVGRGRSERPPEQGGSGVSSLVPPAQEVHREGDGTLECQNGRCGGGRHWLVLAGGDGVVGAGRRPGRLDRRFVRRAGGHARASRRACAGAGVQRPGGDAG